jgi:hypothetical protein
MALGTARLIMTHSQKIAKKSVPKPNPGERVCLGAAPSGAPPGEATAPRQKRGAMAERGTRKPAGGPGGTLIRAAEQILIKRTIWKLLRGDPRE